MFRRLVAWKYLVSVAVVFGCAVFVSHQYWRIRQQCSKKCDTSLTSSFSPSSSAESFGKCQQDAERRLPRWYRLFWWPEGVTAWAILLTLLAIGEQTHQTRRAADISEQVLVSQFRPRVIVRKVDLRVPDPDKPSISPQHFVLEFVLINTGETPAAICDWEVNFEWIPSPPPANLILSQKIKAFRLAAGERKQMDIPIPDDGGFPAGFYFLEETLAGGKSQTVYPVCSGTIIYADGNGTKRRTGFTRAWNVKEARFTASSDPEYEYQD
jgi:hypothetical protein